MLHDNYQIAEIEYSHEVSDYETERNKPMPNLIHGLLQAQVVFLLKTKYSKEYIFPSELSLDSTPPTTPDICIYPKRLVDVKSVTAKEKTVPTTTIEIISPSQSVNELMHKAWDIYFPMGVKSAWIVVPEMKGIHIVLPNDDILFFKTGELLDPATGIKLDMERVFEEFV